MQKNPVQILNVDSFPRGVASAIEGLWEWNIQTNAFWCSESFEKMFGYLPGQFPRDREDILALIHPDDVENVTEALTYHFENGTPYQVEFRFNRPDRGYHWYKSHGNSLRDASNQPTILAGITLDIEQRKRTERLAEHRLKELEASNRSLEEFAYAAAHDLKSPLRGIGHLLKWVINDPNQQLSPESLENIEQMKGRIRRMDRLLDDLLTYAGVGTAESPVVEFDSGERVKELFELMAPPPSFNLHVADNMPLIKAKIAAFDLCFRNLIGNAIKHHDKQSGNISVNALVDPGNGHQSKVPYVCFRVQDDGPGIDERFHERIFRMFQTLKPRDEVEGSGLGLPLVKKTIEEHGGAITLASSPGHGAMFEFTWPKNVQR